MGVFLDVGLTGGISCGKSVALRLFAALDCFTLDADAIYHKLIMPGRPIYNRLVEEFGPSIVDGRKRIDRVVLGEIVFSDPDALARLNAVSHPLVVEEEELIITDAALMIEAGTHKRYDKVVVVSCSPDLQVERLMRRAAIDEEAARRRIAAQMPIEEKRRFADYVINNDESIEALKREVEEVYNYLVLDLRAKERAHV